MDFCMDMYRDTCLEVWNTSFCVESLFGMVVWFGCGPQWRKILYKRKCWVLGEMSFFLNSCFCFDHNLVITHPN